MGMMLFCKFPESVVVSMQVQATGKQENLWLLSTALVYEVSCSSYSKSDTFDYQTTQICLIKLLFSIKGWQVCFPVVAAGLGYTK